MTTAVVRCPFPPCTAEWWVGLEAGQTRVSAPFHLPEGDFEGRDWFEIRCPGALTMFKSETEVLELTALSAEQVNRAYENYLLRLAQYHEQQDREAEAEQGKTGPYIGGPVGRPVDLTVHPVEQWFPGRPADAPEPGPGEPAPSVPADVEGHRLQGREGTKMDDSHARTAQLTSLALGQLGQTQDVLARVTDMLDQATGLASAAEHQITSAQSLVVSAVGSGAGKPAPAEQMAEQTALAVNTVAGTEGGNLFNAINLSKIRVEAANQQIAGAVANGQAYLALLGGASG